MKLLAAVLTVALTACSNMEVTALFGPRANGEYTELVGSLSVVRKLSGRKLCAYQHESEIRNGAPFNSRPEQRSEFIGCGIRWSK